MRRLRLRFWLVAMDSIDLAGRATDRVLRRLYFAALRRASDAEDWIAPA
jgi:hypothetical protein